MIVGALDAPCTTSTTRQCYARDNLSRPAQRVEQTKGGDFGDKLLLQKRVLVHLAISSPLSYTYPHIILATFIYTPLSVCWGLTR